MYFSKVLVILAMAVSTSFADMIELEDADLSLINKSKMHITSAPTLMTDASTATSNSTSSSSWVYYAQCDPSWANNELGTCGSTTICTAGCAMSSTAMMLKTKGVNVDPGSLNSWLKSNGGYASGCDIVWASVDAFGVTSFQGMEKADETAICNGLSAKHGIIANVHNGAHWVLLTGCLGNGMFSVNDPYYSTTSYSINDILEEAVYH
jgi:hypothetical protein